MTRYRFYNIIFILLAFLLLQCDHIIENSRIQNNDYRAESPFRFTVSADGTDRLLLNSMNGRVEVIGQTDMKKAVIEGKKIVKSNSQTDAESFLNELSVHVEKQGQDVLVASRQPTETRGRDVSFEYTIRVPRAWRVGVDLLNGECSLDSLANFVNVKVTNGNVLLDQLICSADLRVTNGQISGVVILPPDGDLDAETTNGLINLLLPRTMSARFYARVNNGLIQLSNLDLTDCVGSDREVRGVLGEGSGNVWLKTTNGNIMVSGY
ncbi:MAG: hypothetical protein U5R06_02655 [candidate division KSB1 bacterium]|nr:hypothetical protein [candidate division KSB1 bacterium]